MSKFIKETDRNQDATVYVGNVDPQADESIIYQLMIQTGPVTSVTMPKDRITDNHQGFAFVEYQYARDAEYSAKVLTNIKLYGKPLRINKATTAQLEGEQLNVGADLFLGNLNPLVDEKTLENTFQGFGKFIKKPTITRDTKGNSKGHGFVYFDSFDAADKAIQAMNGQYLMNQKCRVQYAKKKDGKEQHGDLAERELAKQAKKNKVAVS